MFITKTSKPFDWKVDRRTSQFQLIQDDDAR